MTITIRSAEVLPLRVPFTDGSSGTGLMPAKWTHLDMALVRLESEGPGWSAGATGVCLCLPQRDRSPPS
ncbi:MAG: hypothetical protein HC871_16675, partial [Rhizobiales bacterium]|nr:hypothetical protein [Hyphomicrobiales bacterium]